jgi:hypothetical protein
METAVRTQSLNETDPAMLGDPEPGGFPITRNTDPIAPGTGPEDYPEMQEVLKEAVRQGRTVDPDGYIDLRGFSGGEKDGERWVVSDQFVRRKETKKLTGPEPALETVVRLRGKGWKVLKGMVGMNEDRPGVGIHPTDVDDIAVAATQRISQPGLGR